MGATRKTLSHDQKARFYVYAITDGACVLYVGKGSGRRDKVSARQRGGVASILERFCDEKSAYEAEVKWIAKLKPEMNSLAGGNGPRAKRRRVERKPKWQKDMEAIGLRAYAARLLLGCERSVRGTLDPSKIDGLRKISNGGGA